jgi:lipid II isoglutaminyl synthase (glutamine-hydrolysing)
MRTTSRASSNPPPTQRVAPPGTGGGPVTAPRQPGIPVRTRIALQAGRTATRLSKALRRGRGATIGGEVALRLDPRALPHLAAGRRVALVTGTNGKTTTTRMLADAVRTVAPVAFNDTGANLRNGIVAALDRNRDAEFAVLELDEIYLGPVAQATRPEVIVLLNLSREYTRGVSLAKTLQHWRETMAAIDWPCQVVANVDDPLVYYAASAAPNVVGVAAGLLWADDAVLCPACRDTLIWATEDWACLSCGLHRPEPDWTLDGQDVSGPSGSARLVLGIDGRAARKGALLATAAAAQLGVPPEAACGAINAVRDVDGRYAPYDMDGRLVSLYMVKNPAGWHEMIDIASTSGAQLVFAMDAFGIKDTAVLWDAPAETLGRIPITVTGVRRYDLATWLTACGVPVRVGPIDPIAAIAALPEGEVLVATNYSAFKSMRRRLSAQSLGTPVIGTQPTGDVAPVVADRAG